MPVPGQTLNSLIHKSTHFATSPTEQVPALHDGHLSIRGVQSPLGHLQPLTWENDPRNCN